MGEQISVLEGTLMHSVNLHNGHEAFPFPTTYQWMRNGERLSNSSTITLNYPVVTFHSVSRTQSGDYTLTAINHQIEDPSKEVGRGSGNFQLNVLCKFLPRDLP